MSRQQNIAYTIFLLLVLSIANVESVQGQGKLGRVRDAVRHSKPTNDNPQVEDRDRRDRGRRGSKHRNRGRNCDSGLSLFLSGSFFDAPVQPVHVVHPPAPVIAPPVIVESVAVAAPSVVSVSEDVYQPVVASTFDWGIRLSALGGTDFDDITHGSLGMLLQAPGGLGIDTSVTMIRESGMEFRDHLYLGDVNFVYEPLVSEDFRLRLGIGVNWLGDSYGSDAGFNMTSGFDMRLTSRTIATGEIDFGTIGDTDITHAKISLGRMVSDTTEWTIGYDHLDIGGVTIGSAFTGFRFRF